jgi:hypothetical protein
VTFGPRSIVANNIFAYNSAGVTPRNATFRDNCVYGNRFYDYYPPGGVGDPPATDGNVKQDPKFAAWQQGDFHLQPDSPCVDAGDDTLVAPDCRDVDLQNRIQGARVDIGAHESDGTAWNISPRIVRVATNGDDANDGSTWPLAKKAVQAALDAVSNNGGEVWVAEGTYAGPVIIGPLTRLYGGFKGDETDAAERDPAAHPTTLQGERPTTDAGIVTFRDGTIHTVLDGFRVTGGVGPGIATGSRSFEQISGNEITGNLTGLRFNQSSYAEITHNNIHHNTDTGVDTIDFAFGSPTVSGNLIEANGGPGLRYHKTGGRLDGNTIRSNAGGGLSLAKDEAPSLRVTSNLIVGNGAENSACGGIRLEGSAAILNNTIVENRTGTVSNNYSSAGLYLLTANPAQVIANNIIAFNTSGVSQDTIEAGGATFRNNDVFANAEANFYRTPDPTGVNGNISADPLFVERPGGNYHPMPGSPAVDAGEDSLIWPEMQDLDGHPRVQGARADIGAYELTPPAGAPGEAITALRAAAGLDSLTVADRNRLNVNDAGASQGVVDLLDAARLLRLALDANP